MKILHITKKYPDALGGDAVVVANLRARQEAMGHRVTILTSNCAEIAPGPHLYKYGLKDTPAGLDTITPRRILSLLGLFFCIFGILRKERPDVMHTHSVDMAFCVALAARMFHVPLIHTFHILTFYDDNHSLFRRKIELWLARRIHAEFLTVPNSYDVEKLQAAGFPRARMLPNGVDLDFWTREDSSPRPGNSEAFTFVAIGRLERQKGYENLIEAAFLLTKASTRPFRITLIGEGAQETMLRDRVRVLGLEDTVQFAGRKSKEEVRELLQGADAAVFPSLYETTPLTLLEAWAMGVAVIMTPTGILRNVKPDFGAAYIVPVQNSLELMRTMERCMQDAGHRRIVSKNGHAEAQQYGWSAIARSSVKLYRRVREAS